MKCKFLFFMFFSLLFCSFEDIEHLVELKGSKYVLKHCVHTNLTCYGISSHILTNRELSKDLSLEVIDRQTAIVDEFKYAFQKYLDFGFGFDEFHPLSRSGHMFSDQGIGYTVVDALDTMILMGLEKYYEIGKKEMLKINFDQDMFVNIFETTIRVLGGLLSASFLANYREEKLMELVIDLGERLAYGFNTETGIIMPTINLKSHNFEKEETTSTSEATTLQLEFKYLSYLTKNHSYWSKCEKSMIILNELEKYQGLVPIFIDANDGKFKTTEIRLGSRGDSYYEYLLKQYLITKNSEKVYLDMYSESIQGVKDNLVGVSLPNKHFFIGEINTNNPEQLDPKMDHLVCFLPGNLALGATLGYSLNEARNINKFFKKEIIDIKYDDLQLAEKIMDTCYNMYIMHPSGLAAEITKFKPFTTPSLLHNDMYVTEYDRHYILRPETVESLFIMYRITNSSKYRDWGWTIFNSIKTHCKTQYGYVSIKDVTKLPCGKIDKMETFFLGETLKYLYLLFSKREFLPLSQIVFNTEAHPFPKFEHPYN